MGMSYLSGISVFILDVYLKISVSQMNVHLGCPFEISDSSVISVDTGIISTSAIPNRFQMSIPEEYPT